MTDDTDHDVDPAPSSAVPPSEDVDDTPTIACSRCGREWDLAFELDEMGVGNRAVEQFALDHRRHTGHFPDDVATWRADCRHCPEGSEHLAERPAERWAQTHARHTGHSVAIRDATDEETTVLEGDPGE